MKDSTPFFSVIVPTYNVEQFLQECINSVINQTFTDWELIIVDDGSTDTTCTLCEEYVQKDSRIALYRQKHAMQASARNKGIDLAKGNYITFLDADDYWEIHHLENLSKVIQNCDMCIANNHINFGTGYKHIVNLFEEFELKTKDNIISEIFRIENSLPGAMCLNVFCREFLNHFAIRFNKEYSCSEDLDLFLQGIIHANSISIYTGKYYYYRQNNDKSTTHTMNAQKIMDRLKVYIKWCRYFQVHSELAYADLAGKKLAHDMCYTIRDLYCLPLEKNAKQEIKNYLSANKQVLEIYGEGSLAKRYYLEGSIQKTRQNYIVNKNRLIKGIYYILKKAGIK